MARVETHVHNAALQAYLVNPRGDVAGDVRRRLRLVERGAKKLVRKDTRRLERSIRTQYFSRPWPSGSVGAYTSYALIEHDGTRPHIIRPHLRKRLRFKVKGRVVYATVVRHPGTRGSHFLTIPLRRYAGG